MKRCLIYIDKENNKNSIDLLEVGRQIYGENNFQSYGIAINTNYQRAEGIFDNIINVVDDRIFENDTRVITDILGDINNHYKFDCILIPATQFGRMLAPRLAMRLNVGLVADVTAIHNDNGIFEMVRPAFSGKIMAGIIKIGNGPIMMSVRQNVFSYTIKEIKETNVIKYNPSNIRKSLFKIIEIQEKIQSYDIRDSEVLISGGGGTIHNFSKLELLAKELNGHVSASRKIIDKGIAPRSIQVGQSGKTVNPKLYIALGINGAIQHVEGLKNVQYIISINTNKNAPICSLSDIVVEGDASEFIDKLLEKIHKKI